MVEQLLVPLADYSWIWTLEVLFEQLLYAAVGTIYSLFFFYFACLTLLDVADWVKKTDIYRERIVGCLLILGSVTVLGYFTYSALYYFAVGGYFGIYAVLTSNQDWLVWIPSYHLP